MSMAWNHHENEGVVVLNLPVFLRSDETLNRFRQTLSALMDSGKNYLVLDFSHLILINSAGIAHLLRAAQDIRLKGGDIKAIRLNPAVRELFQYTGLQRKIDILPNESDAVKRFQEITCQ
jgi:anti-anti-sigma factor